MTAEVVCFVSSKGGSGKTVTSSALGTFLSELGFRVLLIDTDASTNGLTILYLKNLLGMRQASKSKEKGLFDIPSRSAPSIVKVRENFHLIPATFTMEDTEKTSYEDFSHNLNQAISKYLRAYDFIILDAQAGADNFARIAAKISDQCIIVSEYDPVSAQGIDRLKVLLSDYIDSSKSWTLFNKILPEFASVIGEGLSIVKYLPPVSWDVNVVRAFSRRDLAINMIYPNTYTVTISQIAYMLFPSRVGNKIEAWLSDTSSNVTSPLKEKLAQLNIKKSFIEKRNKFRQVFAMTLTALLAAIGTYASSASEFLNSTQIKYLLNTLHLSVNNSFVSITAFISIFAIIFGVIGNVVFDTIKSTINASELKDIQSEIEKLETTIQAAESVLRFSQDAGIYEKERRQLAQ